MYKGGVRAWGGRMIMIMTHVLEGETERRLYTSEEGSDIILERKREPLTFEVDVKSDKKEDFPRSRIKPRKPVKPRGDQGVDVDCATGSCHGVM